MDQAAAYPEIRARHGERVCRQRFADGAILVTRTTDPDWVPIMKRAAAIVTDHGGRISQAAAIGAGATSI